jgi:DNA polymerase-3 subunit delta
MKPVELRQAIERGECPSLVCLYGDETFFRDQSLKLILDKTLPADARDFNLTSFQGKETNGQHLLEQLLTLPVFSPRRMVVVKDFHAVSASESDQLLDYLSDPVPETILVLTADKIDKRRKFFQAFAKKGALVEFKPLYDNQIPAFVSDLVRTSGRRLTEDAMTLFCRRVGSNLQEIQGELSKLFAYLGDRNLADVEDVRAIVSDVRTDSVFDLANALGKKQTAEALRLLGRLIEDGIAPLMILAMMVRHFRQLWKTRLLLDGGVGKKELASKLGINPFFVDGLISQSRQLPLNSYEESFELFLAADLKLKSSGGEPRAILEGLIMTLSGVKRG